MIHIEFNFAFHREIVDVYRVWVDFFKSFSDASKSNLNIKAEGTNGHHKIEAIIKAFARAVKMAVSKTGSSGIPSTKGIL